MNIVSLRNNYTNCYLIPINNGWLMIDTGLPDTLAHLLQLLNQQDISIYEINYLLITHFHPDHAGLTQHLRDFGINLILHEEQVPFMSKLNLFYKKNPKANFKDIIPGNALVVSDTNSRSFFETIGVKGNLISTPGHSDDSVSLILDKEGAFTGDLPHYDLMEAYHDHVLVDSWDMLKRYHVKMIYPSHEEPYEIA